MEAICERKEEGEAETDPSGAANIGASRVENESEMKKMRE